MAFWKRQKAHKFQKQISKIIFSFRKKKGAKYKTLQVRFTLTKFGVWKRKTICTLLTFLFSFCSPGTQKTKQHHQIVPMSDMVFLTLSHSL